ncbi:hypothetical protein EOL70_12340 [Leucothrix sargassi]|nr:hypothetical protein EOL70_12340 [Leucothrix sargassi]
MTNSHKPSQSTAQSLEANNTRILDEWRSLSLNLKGQPKNYQLHSQRILFALQSGLNQFLAGALQDLFIALGDQGQPLRSRMFGLVLPLIDQHDREYFHEWLAHSSDASLGCYRALGSVLTSTTCQADSSEPDPFIALTSGTLIEQSRHAIAHGRVEEAQALLTQSINKVKAKPDVTLVEELLSLLAATRQKESLAAFASSLEQQKFTLSKHWKQVLESSKEW